MIRVVWIRSHHAIRHGLAVWMRYPQNAWRTIAVIPLWRKRGVSR